MASGPNIIKMEVIDEEEEGRPGNVAELETEMDELGIQSQGVPLPNIKRRPSDEALEGRGDGGPGSGSSIEESSVKDENGCQNQNSLLLQNPKSDLISLSRRDLEDLALGKIQAVINSRFNTENLKNLVAELEKKNKLLSDQMRALEQQVIHIGKCLHRVYASINKAGEEGVVDNLPKLNGYRSVGLQVQSDNTLAQALSEDVKVQLLKKLE